MIMPGFWQSGGSGCAQPALEVLHLAPEQRRFETPLVFIHGAFVGAWCWQEHFLPWFAAQGFEVYAPSLRGHGGSDGHLNTSGIQDYVADVASVTDELAVTPVLIGHSMGGLVAQRYLEEYASAATVLMASVPLSGLTESTMRLLTGDPALLAQMALMQAVPSAVDPEVAQRAMFSEALGDELLAHYAAAVQPESQRAIWDMTMGTLPRPWRVPDHPMFVMGAEEDSLFRPDEVRRTSEAYGAPVHIEPAMAHAMMVEPGWEGIAARIRDWLVNVGVQ